MPKSPEIISDSEADQQQELESLLDGLTIHLS
jgi:hypothetical protein